MLRAAIEIDLVYVAIPVLTKKQFKAAHDMPMANNMMMQQMLDISEKLKKIDDSKGENND